VPSNHATQGEICRQDGAIVAMTRRDDIHTHDIAFERPDFDPVEHRVSRFLGNTSHMGALASIYFTDLLPAKRDTFGANGALDIGVLGHAERHDGYVYNRRVGAFCVRGNDMTDAFLVAAVSSASGGSRGFPEPLSAAAPLVGRTWTRFAGIRATRPPPHLLRISGSAMC